MIQRLYCLLCEPIRYQAEHSRSSSDNSHREVRIRDHVAGGICGSTILGPKGPVSVNFRTDHSAPIMVVISSSLSYQVPRFGDERLTRFVVQECRIDRGRSERVH